MDLIFSLINILRSQRHWNLSNPIHQGTREMCRSVQDVVTLRLRIVQVPLYL